MEAGEEDATRDGVAGGMNVDLTTRCCEGEAYTITAIGTNENAKTVKLKTIPKGNRILSNYGEFLASRFINLLLHQLTTVPVLPTAADRLIGSWRFVFVGFCSNACSALLVLLRTIGGAKRSSITTGLSVAI